MITSLIEMLELPNFGHMITSTIYFESRDRILVKSILLTPSKIPPCLLEQPLKNQKKFKNLEIFIKMPSTPVFPDITKIADFQWKNADVSRTQVICNVIYVFFTSSFGKV